MTKNTNADQGIPQPASHKFGQVGPFRHRVNLVPLHLFGEENYVLITFYEHMGDFGRMSTFLLFCPKALSIYHARLESLFGDAHVVIPGPIGIPAHLRSLLC